MLNKILKVSLLKDQVENKTKIEIFDGYEIHLLGNGRDDFSLLEELKEKPIKTFHYPVTQCRLGKFKIGENKEYMLQILDACEKYCSGLILHCGDGWDEVDPRDNELVLTKNNKDLFWLIGEMRARNIPLFIENASSVSCKDVLNIINHLMITHDYFRIYPLLDICHYQIAAGRLHSVEYNLAETLKLFESENMKIHFCDSVGCGKYVFGGIHGSNFKYNQPLMKEILGYLKKFENDIDLILEVDEDNYNIPKNAMWLAAKIDEYLSESN